MQVQKIDPPVSPFLKVKLDQEVIDYLWKIIDIGKTNNTDFKYNLVGNISQSLLLEDIDTFFFKSVCSVLIKFYREQNCTGQDPVAQNTLLNPKSKIILNQLWVNYQYETEFNPYHDHSGVYSFAIWMKIPYSWDEQIKLPQFSDINESQRKPGNFEFEYIDTLGGVRNCGYNLSQKDEGTMLFFPATLRHCVYPFYEIKEPRISVAGNLSYLPA